MPSIAERAWMAGVLDLRGRLTYKNNKMRKTRQITLSFDTTETRVLHRMCELTGTQPEMRTQKPLSPVIRRSCIEHCPEAHVHIEEHLMWPKTGRWTVTGSALVV